MSNIIEQFNRHYQTAPMVLSAAPGRLEILGNHTDYNQGVVLSCAVEQRTEFALVPRAGRKCRLVDFRDGSTKSFELDGIDQARPRDWSNYVKGMIVELRKRGIEVGAFDGAIRSTVPLSAGMSSSAALEIAAGFAFKEAFGIVLDNADWARVGQGVENNYMGLNSGLLDQFSSIFGKADAVILSDFRSVEVLKTVSLPPGYRFVVANSMVKHNLVDSEYNTRRRDCEAAAAKLAKCYPGVKTLRDVTPEQLEEAKSALTRLEYLRSKHVVGECDRVWRGVAALETGDVATFGKLLFASHASSMENFENSTAELDYLVELAQSLPGALGARLSGGGFGGITIHLVHDRDAEVYAARLSEAFALKFGMKAETIQCAIGGGAAVKRV